VAELDDNGVAGGHDLVVGGAIDIENDARNRWLRLEQAGANALQAAAVDRDLLKGARGRRAGKSMTMRSGPTTAWWRGYGPAGFHLDLGLPEVPSTETLRTVTVWANATGARRAMATRFRLVVFRLVVFRLFVSGCSYSG